VSERQLSPAAAGFVFIVLAVALALMALTVVAIGSAQP